MPVSIVPGIESNRAVYQVLDDLGRYGRVWTELADDEANEPTIIRWIIEGQFKRPLRIIAFNTGEGWSGDVTREIAEKVLDLNKMGTALGAAAMEFVERVTGKSARALV
jgi:hypothetical protein